MNDYRVVIPGHPDCVGQVSTRGWLTVRLLTRLEAVHVGDYPTRMPLEEVAERVTAWKEAQVQVIDGDGDYDDHMALSVRGW